MNFHKIRAYRKTGVSLESVMLGLVVVLVFASLIYSGYGLMRTYLERQHYDRIARMVLSEATFLANQGPPPGFIKAEQVMDMTEWIIQSGAVPDTSVHSRSRSGRKSIEGFNS